jgi:uncharacterized protein (TIGR03435 family)
VDRFKLAVHRETKQMPVYEIKQLNGNAPPPPAPEPGQSRPNFCDYPHLGRQGGNRTLDGEGISVAGLAKALARVDLHRPLVDRTNLTDTSDTALREQLGLRFDSSRDLSEVIVVDRMEKPSGN